MKIEKICLGNIKSECGKSYNTWIDFEKTNSVYFNGELGGYYLISTILHHALITREDDNFTLTDGYDGINDISISSLEIKRLAKTILTSIPAVIGRFNLSVQFEPCDPDLPF